MKHPSTEEWMSFLYEENSPRQRTELKAHLRSCPECCVKVAEWRAGMRALDQWTLRQTRRPTAVRGAMKWAAAAVIALLLGFGFGRISAPDPGEINSLRRSLTEEFSRQLAATRAEMSDDLKQQQTAALRRILAAAAESANAATQDWLAEFAQSAEAKSAAEHDTIADALKQLDAKWTRNQAALRRELETVAVLTEDGLADTQQRLVQLADIAQTSSPK